MKSMTSRLFLLAHDENIFHPRFFDTLLSTVPYEWVIAGAAMVKSRSTLLQSVRHVVQMGGAHRLAIRLALRHAKLSLRAPHLLSVRGVLARHRVDTWTIDSPNDPAFLERVALLDPDLIFCAVPNILRSQVLALPKLGCMNRHAGRLPDYRGEEPVLHALRRGESQVWVTYHSMDESIDGGHVVWEHAEPVRSDDSVYALYERLFDSAADHFWEAVDALRRGTGRRVDVAQGGYFRYPTADEIDQFKRTGHRYI